NIIVAIVFVIPVGVAAGAFLAVDWALMTDIVPKATSGRYMGISNVVTGAAGPIAIAIGGVAMDRVGAFDFSLGPRVAFLFALVYYALGALLLRPGDQRRRDHQLPPDGRAGSQARPLRDPTCEVPSNGR